MRRAGAALAIVVTLVAGCGDGSSDGADETDEPPTTSTSSTAPEAPEVPAANLTQVELVPPAFPLDEIPTVDGKVISAGDAYVAINAALERSAAFTEAVSRMESAGYVADEVDEAGAEATFTGRGLTVELLVVADGPTNAGVSYQLR